MSIEAKDRQNPSMICAATIQRIDQQGKLLIHFDGWSQQFDYWCEPSTTDIHPPMWCHYASMVFELCTKNVRIMSNDFPI